MTHETLTSSQLSVKAAALRMVNLPLSVYGSLAQVSLLKSVESCSVGVVFLFFFLLFLCQDRQVGCKYDCTFRLCPNR